MEARNSAPITRTLQLAEIVRRSAVKLSMGMDDATADEIAAAVHAACPEACHFFPAEALTAWVMAVKTGAPLPVDPRWSVIDMPFEWQGMRLVDADLLHAARSAGLWVNVWTVDEPEEMRYLVGLGVGGIMTDRPDLLREVLAEIL